MHNRLSRGVVGTRRFENAMAVGKRGCGQSIHVHMDVDEKGSSIHAHMDVDEKSPTAHPQTEN